MIFAFVSLLVSLVPAAQAPPTARPWDVPFSSNTTAIALAARNVARSGDYDVIMLLESHRFTVDADGRSDHTLRKVYRILNERAIEDWATISYSYQPWFEQTPVLRARVIAPDGSVRTLDLKTVADAPTLQVDSTIFSDEREIQAPLPNVVKDSVVEYEITIREKAPMLDSGAVHDIPVDDFIPLERFHFEIDADAKAQLKVAPRLLPAEAIKQTASGKRVRIEADFGPLETRERLVANLPYDEPRYPSIGFSTAQNWQAIAARYDAIVNQRLAGADIKALLGDTNLTGPPREVAARLTAVLHQKIRYTGIEFGEAAIIPGTPAQTIQRGYGDCKDKSALLVAMLRAAGLPASIALLRSGFSTDIDRALPGMGVFDHAIVYVASNPPIWIDATADTFRVPSLPAADQGRLALIASAQTADLVQTPQAEGKDNWSRHDYEIQMKDYGLGSVRETMTAGGGSMEADVRNSYDSGDPKVREKLEKYVKNSLVAKSLGSFEITPKGDMSGPFRIAVEAVSSRLTNTSIEDAAVGLLPSTLFSALPYSLTRGDSKRKRDFVFTDPYRMEMRYHIIPPALFKIVDMPSSSEIQIGTGSLTRKYQKLADGSIEAVYVFDSGKRRLTPAEFESYQTAVDDFRERGPEVLNFVLETNESVATGEISKAVTLLRSAAAEKPNDAMIHARFARVLLSAGLGGPALAEARKAVELAPDSSAAWQVLAWTNQHDMFGRRMLGSWNASEAEKAYRKAIELDADPIARADLAILLEHNKYGRRYAADARTSEAIALYREILKDETNETVSQNLAVALMRTGDFEGAKQEARKAPATSRSVLEAVIASIQEGPGRALVNVQTAFPDPKQRALILANASASLVQLRKYDLAQAMINAAARLMNTPELRARADFLSRMKTWESVALPKDDPRSTVQSLFVAFFGGPVSEEVVKPLMSKRVLTNQASPSEITTIDAEVSDIQQAFATLGLEPEGLLDFMMSLVQYEKDGDDAHGYRITASLAGASMPVMYVIREDGEYRIVGTAPDGYDGIAGIVLEHVDRGNMKDAQWWLDKILDDIKDDSDFGIRAFRGVWSGVTEAGRGQAAIRKAAAVLLATSGDEKSIQMLEQLRAKETGAVERVQLDKAIAESMAKTKKWADLITVAGRISTSSTKLYEDAAFRYVVRGAIGSGKWRELDASAQERLKTNATNKPINNDAIRAQMMAKAALGDSVAAAASAKKLLDSQFVTPGDHTLVAWTQISSGTVDASIVDKIKEQIPKVGPRSTSDLQYAIPLAKVQLKKTDEAQQEFVGLLGRSSEARLSPIIWITYARICQQYGFEGEYRSALEKSRSARSEDDPDAQWALFLLNKGR